MESEISKLQQETDEAIEKMQEKFAKQLDDITEQLFKSIVKV